MNSAQNRSMGVLHKEIPEPVSVLMPVCNEVEGLESVLAELIEVVYRYLPQGSEILIEEGGSTDGTRELLEELTVRWPFLNVEYRPTKEGFAHAARSLYRKAKCPFVFFLDSDGQCVASEFWRLAPCIEDSDFVFGVKKIHYDPFLRRCASRVFNGLARLIFSFRYSDINFGFRLCRKDALLKCLDECRIMTTLLNAELAIIAALKGYRIHEVPVHHRPRIYGISRGLVPGSLLRESWCAFWGLLKLHRQFRKRTVA